MKFCKNCSAALDDNAVFCTECGASLAEETNNTTVSSSFESNSQPNNEQSNNQPNSYEGFQGSIPTGSSNSSYSSNSNYTSNNDYSSNSNYSSNTNYSQPQQQYSAPQGKSPGQPWLIVSIISFFCCGGIFAVPGFILALMSTTSFNAGNLAEAQQRANTAKWLTIGAIIVAVILMIVLFASGFFYTIQEGAYY